MEEKRKKIAVTGGIGSGKSTVLRLLEKMGYPVFSCDAIYREVLDDPAYIREIEGIFPACVVEGKIDLRLLGEMVFQNEEKRLLLNSVAHPKIMQRLEERLQASSSPLTFAEVPLLFEGGYETAFDGVIVVLRRKRTRVKSLRIRDGETRAGVLRKIQVQFPYDERSLREKARRIPLWIVKNNRTEEKLQKKIETILAKLDQS